MEKRPLGKCEGPFAGESLVFARRRQSGRLLIPGSAQTLNMGQVESWIIQHGVPSSGSCGCLKVKIKQPWQKDPQHTMAHIKYKFISFAAVYWKKCTNVRVVSEILFGAKWELIAREAAFQIALRNSPKEVGGRSGIWDCGEGGVHSIKHILSEDNCYLTKVAASHQEQTSRERF